MVNLDWCGRFVVCRVVSIHDGRIVLFYSDGVAWERATDGSRSRHEAVAPEAFRDCDWENGELTAFGSVLLG